MSNNQQHNDLPDINLLTMPSGISDAPEGFSLPADGDSTVFHDLKLLGMGGMGVVYEADDQALERKVALKMLRAPYRNDTAAVSKFVNEARITAKIDHPNIVAVHHLGSNPECGAYFSMRRIRGETLRAILRKLARQDQSAKRHYTLRRLLDIFTAACNGVAAAHQQGILHCDLKPSNIMVGERGEVWVLDWGAAHEAGTVKKQTSVEGTPAFMAPELLNGTAVMDFQSDVYSLGAILFCILTRHDAPFELDVSREELLKNIAAGKQLPLRPAEKNQVLQVELAAICRKAMHRDRSKRYANVQELLNDLHNYQDGFPVSAYSRTGFYRFMKYCRRRPLIPVVTLAALLTLLLHNFAVNFINYTNDNTELRIAYHTGAAANEYGARAKQQWTAMISPASGFAALDMLLYEHDMKQNIYMMMLETFAAFDVVEKSSFPHSRESFLLNGGIETCKKLLRMQMDSGDLNAPAVTLNRFRDRCRKLFDAACALDAELAAKAALIDSSQGQLLLDDGTLKLIGNCTIVRPDGTPVQVMISGGHALRLSAGDNRIYFSGLDGKPRAAFFRIAPGMTERFTLPETNLPPHFILIPGDHWFVPIRRNASIPKRLPQFLIGDRDVSAEKLFALCPAADVKKSAVKLNNTTLMPADSAKIFCRNLSKKLRASVRIPTELELRKSFTPGDIPGESFYGASPVAPGTKLFCTDHRGRLRVLDPNTMLSAPAQNDTLAALRPAMDIK